MYLYALQQARKYSIRMQRQRKERSRPRVTGKIYPLAAWMIGGNLHFAQCLGGMYCGRKQRIETVLVGHVTETLHKEGKRLCIFRMQNPQPGKQHSRKIFCVSGVKWNTQKKARGTSKEGNLASSPETSLSRWHKGYYHIFTEGKIDVDTGKPLHVFCGYTIFRRSLIISIAPKCSYGSSHYHRSFCHCKVFALAEPQHCP